MGTGSFPGVKYGWGVLLTTHPPTSAVVMEEQSYTYTHPLGHTGTVTGTLYLYLHSRSFDIKDTGIKRNKPWK